jgi:signal transduction histidine kinase
VGEHVSPVRSLLALVGVAFVALVVAEIVMGPNAKERADIAILFGGLTVAAGLAVVIAPRVLGRVRSLHRAVLAVALAGVTTVVVAVLVAAGAMFLSPHDARLLLAVGVLGAGCAVVVATAVAGPVLEALDRVSLVAARVGDGDLTERTGVRRDDEIGQVAAGVDAMVERLAEAEAARSRVEQERRVLLASIGHDLRSPLAALRAAVEALEDGVVREPERYLRAMRHDLDALGHLVEDLFLLARIEAGTFEPLRSRIDLTELVDEAVEALQPVAVQRGVRMKVVPVGPVGAMVAPEEVGRVLRNLLDNAIRHAPEGTVVEVSVDDDGGPLVSVVDGGPGFAPAFVDAAFDRFTRADPDRSRTTGGAGLGLAVARGVVEAHGGSIWAEPGPGGRVAFRLPAA